MIDRQVWVGDMGAYNAGNLVGAWIKLDEYDEDTYAAKVKQVTHGADEPWVFDIEGFPDNKEMSPTEAWQIHEKLNEVDDNEQDAYAAFVDDFGDWDVSAFQDSYCGQWSTEEEYASDYLDSTGQLDGASFLAIYFDLEKFTRDLFMDYTSVKAPGGGIFVFRCI